MKRNKLGLVIISILILLLGVFIGGSISLFTIFLQGDDKIIAIISYVLLLIFIILLIITMILIYNYRSYLFINNKNINLEESTEKNEKE